MLQQPVRIGLCAGNVPPMAVILGWLLDRWLLDSPLMSRRLANRPRVDRLLLLAAVLAATVGMLPSCSDSDQPPPSSTRTTGPPGTPTASATTSAAVAPPALPASATADPKGAEVFVRYFWDVFNYTYATGDTKPLRAISDKGCGFCSDVARDVDAVRDKGGQTEGGEVAIIQTFATAQDVAKGGVVTAVLRQEASVTRAQDGEVLSSSPAIARRLAEIAVIHRTNWSVLGVNTRGEDG